MSLMSLPRLLFAGSRRSESLVSPELDALAQVSAEGGYVGLTAEERNVHVLLMRIRTEASCTFRTDPVLRDAQARLRSAEAALATAQHDEGHAVGRRARAAGMSPALRVARTEARAATAARRTAESGLVGLRVEVEALEARLIDAIGVAIETGLGEVNGYVAAFNAHASYKGRPSISPLNVGETSRQLLSDAVRPLLTQSG